MIIRKPVKGEKFIPIVKRSERSRTLGGRDGTGQRVLDKNGDPFVCTDSKYRVVEARGRRFSWDLFDFEIAE